MRSKRCKIRIKKGDMVVAVAGNEAMSGKAGKVLFVDTAKQRVIVEGFNLVKKHMRKSENNPEGGIIEMEAPIHVSNLKLKQKAE